MKQLLKISLLALVMMSASLATQAQKIAVVDTDALLAASPEVKRANSQLSALKKQFEKRLQGKYEAMQNKYASAMQRAQAGTLSKNDETTISAELQKMQEDIAKSEQQMQSDLLKKEEEYLKPILEKLRANIKSVAKAKGFDYVVNINSMISFPDSSDITAAVKAKLGYK